MPGRERAPVTTSREEAGALARAVSAGTARIARVALLVTFHVAMMTIADGGQERAPELAG